MPDRCSRNGAGLSPPLEISGAPAGTETFALIMDDPDAPRGTWVHWLAWNIPGQARRLEEGDLPAVAMEGRNSWGEIGYGGPQPPSGTHRYFFRLFALDTFLELPETCVREELEKAMRDHVVAEAVTMGTYSA